MRKCFFIQEKQPNTSNKVVSFSKLELLELREVFKNSMTPIPRWLMPTTKITRPRRKQLMDLLEEAGCGESWCSYAIDPEHWSTHLHVAFHKLEEAG